MKQFGKIFRFEFRSLVTNKTFAGVTVFIIAAIIISMFFPRFISLKDESKVSDGDKEVILLSGENADSVFDMFSAAFPDEEVRLVGMNEDEIRKFIENEDALCAFVLSSPLTYKYYVNNAPMYDTKTMAADEILESFYRLTVLQNAGMPIEEASAFLSSAVSHETVKLGTDQMKNFLYTYIMIFALYFVILFYGQMVALNVATEKSSRAMELLITSASPVSMMFGKVIASCMAGFIQLAAIFGTAIGSYRINREFWTDNMMVNSIFDMPAEIFLYMLLFFILGYFIYSFMFGAVGSTVSRLEDVNTAVMPATMLLIIGFAVVVFSMSSGNPDSTVMKICSFVPFTSPMAMFTRIAMGVASAAEIIISVIILILSVVGIGYVSAKIYRAGVLMYGQPPKIGTIIKAIKSK